MRAYLFLAVLVFSGSVYLGAQRDPSNPFPNHETPPANWTCVPAKTDQDVLWNEHACACLGMVKEPMCPETPEETQQRQDSSRCKVYCHRDNCACALNCAHDS